MKTLLFYINILLCGLQLNAQWEISNSNVIGGIGDENFNDVVALFDGYIAVGYTTSSNSGDISEASNGLSDYWIVKFDLNGKLIWEKNYGGLGNDVATTISQTDENSFWVFGTIDSSGNDINTHLGKTDAWGIYINNQGELLNQITIGGSQDDEIIASAINQSDELRLVGNSQSNDGNITGLKGQTDAWYVVINNNGELIKSKTFGGTKKEVFNDITYNSENNTFYIGGFTNSADGNISEQPQLKDTWLLAIKNDTIVWEKTWGGSSAEAITDITLLPNGDIAFCGETSSPEIEDFKGTFDVVAGLYNSNGELQWGKAYGGTAAETPSDIVISSSGNISFLAFSNSIGGNVGLGYQAFNVWLTELNPESGNIVNTQLFGGNKWDFGSALIPLENDGYFMLANTDSFDGDVQDDGKAPTPKDGNHDIWVANLISVSTSNTVIEAPETFSIYPNPANGFFTIETENNQSTQIEIYNTLGQLVLTTESVNEPININEFQKGVYYVKICDNDNCKARRIVVR